METERLIGHAPRTTEVGIVVATEVQHCVGCTGCRGLCAELLEMIAVPDVILNKGRTP